MKADWKDPSEAPLGVRLLVCEFSYGYGHGYHDGEVSFAKRVEGSVWVDDSNVLCKMPHGWDQPPTAITMEEVREHRAQAQKDKP